MIKVSMYVCYMFLLYWKKKSLKMFLINKKKFVQGVDFEEGNQVLRNKICQQYQYLKVRFIKLKF